jgi:hypothetical protein
LSPISQIPFTAKSLYTVDKRAQSHSEMISHSLGDSREDGDKRSHFLEQAAATRVVATAKEGGDMN